MTSTSNLGALAVLPITLLAASCLHAQTAKISTVRVMATPSLSLDQAMLDGDHAGPEVTADTASLVRRVPGAALTYNGALAGQVQYRGLFGARNNVLVNGMHIDPGGPNWMDPPLHYVPRPILDSLTLSRGIAPVSDGIETLGVTVRARSRQAGFSDGADGYRLHGYGEAGYGSVDHGFTTGGMLGVSGPLQYVDIVAARTHGDDARYGDGRLRGTGYSRNNAGIDYGVRWDANTLHVQWLYDDTGPSGNPTLPMDTAFLHSSLANLSFTHKTGDGHVDARLYYIHVDHAMDNDTLRSPPDFNAMMPGPDARRIPATAADWGLDTSWTQTLGQGTLDTGFDAYLSRHSATVTDPQVPAFNARLFNDAERNLYSLFSQWQSALNARSTLQLGARYTRVHTQAGEGRVSATLPKPAHLLTQDFNAADRTRNDDNVDLMARLDYRLDDTRALRFELARKTRSPSYLERYAYIPLEASAGQADGNNYVGDIDLKPEVAYEADVGLTWSGDRFTLTPRIFFDHIHHYITGLPIDRSASAKDLALVMVSTLNGDPTPLRYSNVQAQLYGADTGWSWALSPVWTLQGSLSYTRGLRAGSGDDLFRVAPFHGRVQLSWQSGAWQWALAEEFAAAQHRVSRANEDTRLQAPQTAGYGLTDLSVRFEPAAGTSLQFGVANVFDRTYTSVLDGYNRVSDSGVPVGARLPGLGRNVYLQVSQAF